MIKINFNSNTIVFYSEHENKFISISLTYRILAFCINDNFIAVCEDWQQLSTKENLHIYDLKGNFLFNVQTAPRALYGDGFYSSIGFENDNVLIAQSADFRYKFDLVSKKFISEEYTK
ncbi:MAG: hypothetical protein GX273_00535 [Bacteroidales bacterium]|nr:hypothetical protein [Bacteroidales bacterium]